VSKVGGERGRMIGDACALRDIGRKPAGFPAQQGTDSRDARGHVRLVGKQTPVMRGLLVQKPVTTCAD
jgi:hypothetical protein